MHVLVVADMEGAAGITDHRECWPVFPHYWRTGRQHLTADVAAVAAGLFAGGATAVTVIHTAKMSGRTCWPRRSRLGSRLHTTDRGMRGGRQGMTRRFTLAFMPAVAHPPS
jgi:hypothetical protein